MHEHVKIVGPEHHDRAVTLHVLAAAPVSTVGLLEPDASQRIAGSGQRHQQFPSVEYAARHAVHRFHSVFAIRGQLLQLAHRG